MEELNTHKRGERSQSIICDIYKTVYTCICLVPFNNLKYTKNTG